MNGAKLPQQLPWERAQTVWAQAINPALSCPLVKGQLLKDVELSNGQTVINHLLGRKLQGWFIVGIDAAATVYDSQATNQTPQLTLVLNSNAVCTANLWVF